MATALFWSTFFSAYDGAPGAAENPVETISGRAALAEIIKLAESQTLLRQGVDVRRLDFTAEATEVRVAHVIGHEDDDVGLLGGDHQAHEEAQEC